jgi:hypothetical protein
LRRYLLSGLLVCEHCGGRFIATGKNGSHYICSTHTQGGEAACPVGTCISRAIAERIVLEPIQRDLLGPEAIERACELMRSWVRNESALIAEGANPELEAIAAEIADLEALIEARPARTTTLRQVIEELRTREANLKRGVRRQAQAKLAGQVPAEEAYQAAVAEMAGTLEGSNVEAARVALRSLIGTVPVFENAGKLYGRIGVDPMPLYRRNPSTFGVMVAGARFGAIQEVSCASAMPSSCSETRSRLNRVYPTPAVRGIRSRRRTCRWTIGRSAGVAGSVVASAPPRFGHGKKLQRRQLSMRPG